MLAILNILLCDLLSVLLVWTCISVSMCLATSLSSLRSQAVALSILLVLTCFCESDPLVALVALLGPRKRIRYADTGTVVPVTLSRFLPRLDEADGTVHARAAEGLIEMTEDRVLSNGGFVAWRSLNYAVPERVVYHTIPMFVHECTPGEIETTGPYRGYLSCFLILYVSRETKNTNHSI